MVHELHLEAVLILMPNAMRTLELVQPFLPQQHQSDLKFCVQIPSKFVLELFCYCLLNPADLTFRMAL